MSKQYDEVREFRREGDGEITYIARYDDLFVGFDESQSHPVDLDKTEVMDVYHDLVHDTPLNWAGSLSGKTGVGVWTTANRIRDVEAYRHLFATMKPKVVWGIAPEHHAARGTIGDYILSALHGPGTDRIFTPESVKESINGGLGYFHGSKAMGEASVTLTKDDDGLIELSPRVSVSPIEGSDQVMINVGDSNESLIAQARESDAAMRQLYDHSVPGAVMVTQGDFDELQRLNANWADETFGPKDHDFRFERLLSELEEIKADPQNPSEWADAMMPLFHGALVEGFTMSDILVECFRKMEMLQKREYYQDAEGNWQYRPKPGFTWDEITNNREE